MGTKLRAQFCISCYDAFFTARPSPLYLVPFPPSSVHPLYYF